jgi:hypothetical protein
LHNAQQRGEPGTVTPASGCYGGQGMLPPLLEHHRVLRRRFGERRSTVRVPACGASREMRGSNNTRGAPKHVAPSLLLRNPSAPRARSVLSIAPELHGSDPSTRCITQSTGQVQPRGVPRHATPSLLTHTPSAPRVGTVLSFAGPTTSLPEISPSEEGAPPDNDDHPRL